MPPFHGGHTGSIPVPTTYNSVLLRARPLRRLLYEGQTKTHIGGDGLTGQKLRKGVIALSLLAEQTNYGTSVITRKVLGSSVRW